MDSSLRRSYVNNNEDENIQNNAKLGSIFQNDEKNQKRQNPHQAKDTDKKFSIIAGDNLGDEHINEQARKFDDANKIKVDDSSSMISMSVSKDNEEFNSDFLLTKTISEILQTFEYTIHEDDIEAHFDTVLIENRFIRLYKGRHKKIGNCSVLVLNDVKHKKLQFINLLRHLRSYQESTKHHVLLKCLGTLVFEKFGKVYFLFEPITSTYKSKKDKNAVEHDFKFFVLFQLLEFTMEIHESNQLQFHSLRFDNLLFNVYEDLRVLPPSGNHSVFILINRTVQGV